MCMSDQLRGLYQLLNRFETLPLFDPMLATQFLFLIILLSRKIG